MSHSLLEPYRPSAGAPFDRTKAAHLLARAGFGGTEAEIAQVLKEGPEGAVDRLLSFPDAPAAQSTPESLPDLSAIGDYPKSFKEFNRLLAGKSAEERRLVVQKLMLANRQVLQETGRWWLSRMISGPYPLQEKLTLLWHGHFTTSARDERMAILLWNQNETLRTHAAGNFRAFTKAISRDPAMLDYLNNTQNNRRKPNENYARELMELFTLGIGHYTETDVKEAARAFTGWGHEAAEFKFTAGQHDFGPKTFLGQSGNFDGDDIIDLITRQKACGDYIGAKVFSWFAYEEPEESLVQALGEVLRKHDYEVRPVLRTILTSRAFYSPRAIGTQVKSPVQLLVGTLRMTGLPMPATFAAAHALQTMGQVPFMPPNVKGWPGGRAWINTNTLLARQNAAINWLQQKPPPGAWEIPPNLRPPEIVTHWTDRLLQRPIRAQQREVLQQAVRTPMDEDATRKLLSLVVSMPEFQLC